jgi:isocitrate lyase
MASAEEKAFAAEAAAIKQWFASPRFANVKRAYSPEQVASLRSTLPHSYPSDVLAKKLWATLVDNKKNGKTSHTFGALDPVQVIQMAKCVSLQARGWATERAKRRGGKSWRKHPGPCCPHLEEKRINRANTKPALSFTAACVIRELRKKGG